MPGLLESCRIHFDTDNLYDVLCVKKGASENDLKRGYHKVSLKVHPDRVSGDDKEDATAKFQTLGKIYSILSDKDKRAVYDETGEIDEENDTTQDRDWFEYWRLLYQKVSVDDIKEFEEKYKGSCEELEDLKAAYKDCKGDMDEILNTVLCATIEDEERFTALLSDLIKVKELPKYKAFTKDSKSKKKERKKRAAAEAEEAEEMAEELGMKDKDLHAMIATRNQQRGKEVDSFFAHLEEKYAKPKKSKKGK